MRRGALWNEGVETQLHRQIIFQLVQKCLLIQISRRSTVESSKIMLAFETKIFSNI